MKLQLWNTVLLAEDYPRMRDWYVEALDLEIQQEWSEDYHYAELVRDGQRVLGIADTHEMNAKLQKPRANATVMQLCVDDIDALFARVRACGGEAKDPHTDKKEGFRYGGFRDPEGNSVWVIEERPQRPA